MIRAARFSGVIIGAFTPHPYASHSIKRWSLLCPFMAVVFFALPISVHPIRADDRLFIPGKINNRPARIILDTGAPGSFYLVETALQEFGVQRESHDRSTDSLEETSPIPISVFQQTVDARFTVVPVPPVIRADFDAMVGWGAIRFNWCILDLPHRLVSVRKDPIRELDGWRPLRLDSTSPVLTVVTVSNGHDLKLHVDTGAVGGVRLSSDLWTAWRAKYSNAPKTLGARYNYGTGMVVQEIMFARELNLGEMTLHNVLVSQQNKTEASFSEGSSVVLSLDILEQVALITSPDQATAYFRTSDAPPTSYNRLGAVFVPDTNSNNLIATVLRSTPAWKAGIRNGDILVSIDGNSFADIQSCAKNMAEIFSQPAGTSIEIAVRRRGRNLV